MSENVVAAQNFIASIKKEFPDVLFDYKVMNEGAIDEYVYLFHNYEEPEEDFFDKCYHIVEEEFYSKGIDGLSFSYDYEEYLKEPQGVSVENIKYLAEALSYSNAPNGPIIIIDMDALMAKESSLLIAA